MLYTIATQCKVLFLEAKVLSLVPPCGQSHYREVAGREISMKNI